MATGDVVMFNESGLDAWQKVHDLPNDALKVGIVDNTITPTAADATPRWSDYSANEVVSTGNYVAGGMILTTVTLTMVSGVPTLAADDINIALHASGFVDGYWGILFNDTAGNDEAIGFIDLGGPVSEQAGPVDIEWTGGIVLELPANVAA